MEQYPTKHYPTRTALHDPDDPILRRWRRDNLPRIRAWEAFAEKEGRQPSETAKALALDGIHVLPAADLVGKAYLRDTHEQVVKQVCTHEAQQRIEDIKQRPWKDFVMMIRLAPEVMLSHPALNLACYPPLLKAVADYLGMWPRLADICIHVNYPTETEASASQLWHRDPGDIKLCKVFIYLCDVTPENGPFNYITGTQPFGRFAHVEPPRDLNSPGGMSLDERLIRWTDAEVESVIPRDQWLSVTGPTHTMIVADTVGLHRGLKPKTGGRILICFTYASGISAPLYVLKGKPVWAKEECQQWALR